MSYSCILCDRSLHSVVTPIMEKEEAGDDERLIATNPVPVAAVPVAAVSAVAVPAAAPTQDPSKTERLVQLREEESSNDSSTTMTSTQGVTTIVKGKRSSSELSRKETHEIINKSVG
jgi:hypothetical protein